MYMCIFFYAYVHKPEAEIPNPQAKPCQDPGHVVRPLAESAPVRAAKAVHGGGRAGRVVRVQGFKFRV